MTAFNAVDYGWFTPPDLDLLFNALAKLPDPGNFVLVGGQSLSFWVDFFDIQLPALEGPYLTADADFMGSRKDAELLAKKLGAVIKVATLDDFTPNLAVLTYQGSQGQKLLIDVLSGVIGLSDDEVKRHAISLERKGVSIHVLHPILCLQSRLENLLRLPSKRNGNGISQAVVAVSVANRFVSEMHNIFADRGALKWVKRIRRIALSDASVFCFKKYQIDVLDAVDPTIFASDSFKTKDWPNIVRWVGRRRAIALKKD